MVERTEPAPSGLWQRLHPGSLAAVDARVAGLALVGAGWVLRIARYLHDRSLWGDEARLALNLRDRSFDGLVHPLSYVQAAPTGFLLAEKAAVRLFGDGEYALRLLPLLAGLASLALFLPLARRLLPTTAALVAVGFYALVEPLVYYSSELKQYSFDPLATVVLLLIAAPALLERSLSTRRALALLAAGAVAFWFSHPSVFVAGAVWLALAVVLVRSRGVAPLTLAGVGLVWLAVFGASYALVLRNASRVSEALGLGSTTSHYQLANILRDGWHAFAYPVGFAATSTALAATFAVVGAVALLRRAPEAFAALGLAVAVTVLAALLGRYPFYDRFLLFIVPIVLLFVVAGLDELRRIPGGTARSVWIAATLLLAAYPAGQAAAHLLSPPGHEEAKPVLARMADAWRPGDSLYVSTVAQYPLRYYAECNDCGVLTQPSRQALRRTVLAARGGPTALHSTLPRVEIGHVDDGSPLSTYIADFRKLDGRPRVWFLFTSSWDDTETKLVLGCMGHLLDSTTSTRAAAYLYDLRARPDNGPAQCPGEVSPGG